MDFIRQVHNVAISWSLPAQISLNGLTISVIMSWGDNAARGHVKRSRLKIWWINGGRIPV